MTLHSTALPGRQQFQRNIAFAYIAGVMCWLDIVLRMSALRLTWTRLKRNNVVKSQTARTFAFGSRVNWLIADVAVVAIAFKDSFVVYLFNESSQLTSLPAKASRSRPFRVSVTPCLLTLTVGFFILQIISGTLSFEQISLFTLSLMQALLVCWCLAPFACNVIKTWLALSSTFWEQFKRTFLVADTTKFVARTWNRLGICFSQFAFLSAALLTVVSSWGKGVKVFILDASNADFREERKLNRVLLNGVVYFAHSYMAPEKGCVAQRLHVLQARVASIHMPQYTTFERMFQCTGSGVESGGGI